MSKQEERLTAKSVRDKVLPQVRQLREDLETDLGSLRYLRTKSPTSCGSTHTREESQLAIVKDNLKATEDRLRSIGEM